MLLQPQIDLLRPQLIGWPSKLRPKLLEPFSSQWGLEFDEVPYVNCGNKASLQAVPKGTIFVRFRPDVVDFGLHQLVSKDRVGPNALDTGIGIVTNNKLRFAIRYPVLTANDVFSDNTVTKGEWLDVACTWGDGMKMFLGGAQQVDTDSYSGAALSTSVDLTFGTHSNKTFYPFGGLIKMIAIYGRILSQEEILLLSGYPLILPDMRELLGLWRFQEGFGVANGTVIRDWSGQGNHGSMQNFSGDPWVNVGTR